MLERETYEQMVYPQYPQWRDKVKPYSFRLFDRLVLLWLDWLRGIPPSKAWSGRGAQNPRLLRAFAALDSAKTRAQRYMRQNPP